MRTIAIIVAGGSGTRFGAELPKQFLELGGKPILMRTISAFGGGASDRTAISAFEGGFSEVIVTLPEGQMDLWRELCERYPVAGVV